MTTLRLLGVDDAEQLEQAFADPAFPGAYQFFGFRDRGGIRRRIVEGTTLRDDGGMLAIATDNGGLVGWVSWQHRQWGPPPYSFSWMLGIMLLPECRGQGHGSAAQRQIADYLFAHTTMERVEASTASENVAEQRALERAGFTREGVMRRAQWRDGSWQDEVLFSKLRGEP
jgi:aminoglycoside 6'-N-acetyltransferase